MKFVSKLDLLLAKRGDKRPALCQATGIAMQTISNWDTRGTLPQIDIGFKIAAFFGISMYELFQDVDGIDVSTEGKILRKRQLLPRSGENPALYAIFEDLRDVSAADLSTIRVMIAGLSQERRDRLAVAETGPKPYPTSRTTEIINPDEPIPAGLKRLNKNTEKKQTKKIK